MFLKCFSRIKLFVRGGYLQSTAISQTPPPQKKKTKKTVKMAIYSQLSLAKKTNKNKKTKKHKKNNNNNNNKKQQQKTNKQKTTTKTTTTTTTKQQQQQQQQNNNNKTTTTTTTKNKTTLKWLSTVRMVIICLTTRGKSYFIIYHVGSVRHYFLGHFGILCFSWMDCIFKDVIVIRNYNEWYDYKRNTNQILAFFHFLFQVNVLKVM